MTAAERVVAAASACIGVRFRLHGRDPSYGLDCVGLAAVALRAGGFAGVVPDGYALRGGDAGTVATAIAATGLVPAKERRAGDLLLVRAGPAQLHLAIASGTGVIHADAVLRRVVERPGPPLWPEIGRWHLGGE